MYSLEPITTTLSSNFDYTKHEFYMKNNATNTYLAYDNITYFLYDINRFTEIRENIFFLIFVLCGQYYHLHVLLQYRRLLARHLSIYYNHLLIHWVSRLL